MENDDGKNGDLRSRAEAKIKKRLDRRDSFSVESAQELLHELDVHQIELEMQNQELRQAYDRLGEVSDQYTDLFDFAPVGYLLLNHKGIITNLNLTACSMLGIERSRLLGKPFSAYMTRDESTIFFKELRKAFVTGYLPSFSLQIKRVDKVDFFALLNGSVALEVNPEDRICRVAMQDITELRKMEALEKEHKNTLREKEFLRLQNEKLELEVVARTKEISDALESERKINAMKSDFIAVASHELRTPFTVILSSAILVEKFKNRGQYEEIDKHIARIRGSIKKFTNILDDFFSLESLEKGNIRAVTEEFHIPEFTARIIEGLKSTFKENQYIEYSHEGSTYVHQDKKILESILVNVLNNAIKYSENKVILKTYNEDEIFTFTVQDEGIGIPEDEREYIFKRFFRAKNVKDFKGTGLGLSIVERYIQLLDGAITFTSEINKGSTFTVKLPSQIAVI